MKFKKTYAFSEEIHLFEVAARKLHGGEVLRVFELVAADDDPRLGPFLAAGLRANLVHNATTRCHELSQLKGDVSDVVMLRVVVQVVAVNIVEIHLEIYGNETSCQKKKKWSKLLTKRKSTMARIYKRSGSQVLKRYLECLDLLEEVRCDRHKTNVER